MKMYKVYAKCVLKSHPIEEINERELKECIDDLLNYHWNNITEEYTEREMERLGDIMFIRAEEILNETGSLQCGDYEVILSKEYPTRPNKCDFDNLLD